MPVVVSMLNSYSGWAAAMAGFTLGNDLLIVTGALVGSSGAYLSYIMCQGMNRSFSSVILGGFGDTPAVASGEQKDYGTHTETTTADVARLLKNAKSVVVTPGYGMAVAQAQFPVADLTRKLLAEGVDVKFGIHPVAGRMPGHMNVLLAEADVDYEKLYEMEAINDDFAKTDAVVVIGANDVLNPAARNAEGTPIYGMPVLNVDQAPEVIICNFDLKPGYAGVENPLYSREKGVYLELGDAKETLMRLIAGIA